MRREFSKAVRAAAMKRCTDDKGIPRCEECHLALKAGGFAFDHDRADGLLGEPTLANCRVLCTACHSTKTREHDVPAIARAKRLEASHLAINTPSRNPLRSRGFSPAPKRIRRTAAELARMRGRNAR